MNPRNITAALALAGTLAGLGAVIALDAGKEVPIDTKPLDTQKETPLQPEKLAKLPDAGKGYVVEVRTDAGVELRITTAKCVRATGKVTTCQRRLPDGGSRYFGALNRFPATEGVGTSCESVACSVYAGEDADAVEDDVLKQEETGNVGGK